MSGKAIRETLGFLAVVASLVFVGLEIQQNTTAVRGATLQSISDAYTGFIHANSLDASIREVELLAFDGATREDLTPDQNHLLTANLISWVGMLENTYLQYRLGLVDEAVFEGYGWNRGFHQTTYFDQWWDGFSGLWVSPEFQDFFESRVQIGPTP